MRASPGTTKQHLHSEGLQASRVCAVPGTVHILCSHRLYVLVLAQLRMHAPHHRWRQTSDRQAEQHSERIRRLWSRHPHHPSESDLQVRAQLGVLLDGVCEVAMSCFESI